MANTTEPAKSAPGSSARVVVEAVTLVVVAVPVLWLLLQWSAIPAVSPHLHHSRASLWVMPAYMIAVYLVLSEYGLLARLSFLRQGQSLFRLRPIFLAYLLTARLEVLALLAVLSLAMDRSAVTGITWPARGFITASLAVVGLTILLFLYLGARAAYQGASQSPVRPS